MSKFQELKQELEELACPECMGYGECDDAEPGDISYNTWDCPSCKGTGINPLYTVSLYIGIAK
ncbi:anti-termination protein Q-like protein [Salmonella phage GSW6]|uniref:Anti-termination protein Q-like protein n=1 Tax=Salmonella phage GSW6 TaxID=3025422 RepID=A0AAF0C0Z0_9CAUD|nr:anti-termination protein Q-like protein [Salmonella phage GSW6]